MGLLSCKDMGGPLLTGMFRCGGVRPPDQRGPVTVYRGGQGDVEAMRRGWSWTTREGRRQLGLANTVPRKEASLCLLRRVRGRPVFCMYATSGRA